MVPEHILSATGAWMKGSETYNYKHMQAIEKYYLLKSAFEL